MSNRRRRLPHPLRGTGPAGTDDALSDGTERGLEDALDALVDHLHTLRGDHVDEAGTRSAGDVGGGGRDGEATEITRQTLEAASSSNAPAVRQLLAENGHQPESGSVGPAQDAALPRERLGSLASVVDSLRRGRDESERRALGAENALAAARRNLELVSSDLDRVREDRSRLAQALALARDHGDAAATELSELVGVREERDRLAGEREEHVQRIAALERERDDLDTQRSTAQVFAADASRDLGEAMGDLMEAGERVDALESELADERAARAQFERATESLTARLQVEQDQNAAALHELGLAHEVTRAEAAAQHGRAMGELMAARERADALDAELADERAARTHYERATESLTVRLRAEQDQYAAALEEMRGAHDAVRADAAAQYGRALGDLMEARERVAALEVELADERAARTQFWRATESLKARLQAEQDQHTVALEGLRSAHDGALADAAAEHGRTKDHLMEARERVTALEADLADERGSRIQSERAIESLKARLQAERDQNAAALEDLRRAHEAARAATAEEHGRAMEEMAAEVARAQQLTADTRDALTVRGHEVENLHNERDQRNAELEVVRQRLREEIDNRAHADQRWEQAEEELTYLRSEIFAGADPKSRRGGRFGRGGPDRPRRAAASPADPKTAARRRDASAPPAPVEATPEDLDAAVDRRLFGD